MILPAWQSGRTRTCTWQSPPYYDWKTSAPRRLENFVDFSHFPFVHENILGTRDQAEIEDHEVWREGQMLRFDRYVVEPNDEQMKQILGISDDVVTVLNRYYLTLPGTIYLLRIFPNGKRYGLFMVSAPTGPATCRNFWHIGSDFARTDEDLAFLIDFELNGAGPGPTRCRIAMARAPPGPAERRDVHKGGGRRHPRLPLLAVRAGSRLREGIDGRSRGGGMSGSGHTEGMEGSWVCSTAR